MDARTTFTTKCGEIKLKEVNELTSPQKNCDHVMKLMYYDIDGTSRCSGCNEPLTQNQIRMSLLKQRQIILDELEAQHNDKKVNPNE